MIDLRCPQCHALLLRFNPGEGVEGYCSKCKLEVIARRRGVSYIISQRPLSGDDLTTTDATAVTIALRGVDKT